MKIIEKKDNQITFSAEVDESLANAIRRYVDQIPILAIDEIENNLERRRKEFHRQQEERR